MTGDRLDVVTERLAELDEALAMPDVALRSIENRIRATYRKHRGVFVIDLSNIAAIRARDHLRADMDTNNRQYAPLRAERAKLRQEERSLNRRNGIEQF